MDMDVDEARSRLSGGLEAIESMVAGIDDEEATFRPGPEEWSVMDVLDHLLFEETEDFRPRLRATLKESERSWPAAEPHAASPHEVPCRARSARALVERLREERAVSLVWLATLDAADLGRSHGAAHRKLRAGDLLASWVAHDLVRLRQLAAVRLAWWTRRAAPFEVAHAIPEAG
jgi:hypothetical protein